MPELVSTNDLVIADQIAAEYSAGQIARNVAAIKTSVETRKMTDYSSSCGGQQATGGQKALAITTTAGRAGLSATAGILGGLQAIPVFGQIIAGAFLGITAILGIFSKHHAQAVAKERGTLCPLVPQLEAELEAMDSAYATGKVSRTEALANLDQTKTNFDQAAEGVTQTNPCNAACFFSREFAAQVDIRRQKDYTKFIVPTWAKYAGLGVAGLAGIFFVARKFL